MPCTNINRNNTDEPFVGVRRCKECGERWLKNFMPATCTKCGTPLAETSGEGFEPHFQLFEKLGLTPPAFRCKHCGKRVYEQLPFTECPHCHADISRMTRRSRRMFMKGWRKVGVYWRIYSPFRQQHR